MRRYFPGQDPIGQRTTLGWNHGLAEERPPEIYLPYAQRPMLSMSLVVRSAQDPGLLVEAVRTVLRQLDADLPPLRVQTLEEVVSRSIARPRYYAVLLAPFAGTALGLAALGATALAAGAIPAWRAARVDPLQALRVE